MVSIAGGVEGPAESEGVAVASPYTLRLFLSVDLVGSTAFKFGTELEDGLTGREGRASPHGWLSTIERFYDRVNQDFLNSFDDGSLPMPSLWKALGDELIYVVEVWDRGQVAAIVERFIVATQKASEVVRGISPKLDCKATAWLADFPARNASINLEVLHRRRPITPAADGKPDAEGEQIRRDYIGPSMDAGFRLGKLASHRKFIISVELAYVLAVVQSDCRKHPFTFGYDGREDLKGVLGGESYPILWLDIENDPKRRATNRREAAMLQRQPEVTSDAVVDFCECYIRSSPWMEVPMLVNDRVAPFNLPPDSLKAYVDRQVEKARKEAPILREEDRDTDPGAPGKDPTADELLKNMPNPDPPPDSDD